MNEQSTTHKGILKKKTLSADEQWHEAPTTNG